MARSFADARVQGVRGLIPSDDAKDFPLKRDVRMQLRQDFEKLMQGLLGPVVKNATTLQRTDGTTIGPARVGGEIVRWTYWAPARKLLIMRFRRGWPEGGSDGPWMQGMRDWVAANELECATVGPGQTFNIQDLRRYLGQN